MAIGPVTIKKRGRNLERFDIVLTVLLAGWVPSILMLLVSYTTLKKTLESKILRDRKTIGYIGASILIERIGRRLSSISFTDRTVCQIVDQQGFPLFTADFKSETEPRPRAEAKLISDIQTKQSGHLSRAGNIYSF